MRYILLPVVIVLLLVAQLGEWADNAYWFLYHKVNKP